MDETFLLTGVTEELISRGVILTRLAEAYRPAPAVTITAALFGLQHFSALALTGRGLLDVAENVVLSGTYGFALAAFQLRFRWLWPLILIHAAADWTTSFALRLQPVPVVVLIHLGLLGHGVAVLRWRGRPGSSAVPPAEERRPARDAGSGSAARGSRRHSATTGPRRERVPAAEGGSGHRRNSSGGR